MKKHCVSDGNFYQTTTKQEYILLNQENFTTAEMPRELRLEINKSKVKLEQFLSHADGHFVSENLLSQNVAFNL